MPESPLAWRRPAEEDSFPVERIDVAQIRSLERGRDMLCDLEE